MVTSAPRLEVPETDIEVNEVAAPSRSKLPEIVKLSPDPSLPARVLANCTIEPVKSKVPLMVTASL